MHFIGVSTVGVCEKHKMVEVFDAVPCQYSFPITHKRFRFGTLFDWTGTVNILFVSLCIVSVFDVSFYDAFDAFVTSTISRVTHKYRISAMRVILYDRCTFLLKLAPHMVAKYFPLSLHSAHREVE